MSGVMLSPKNMPWYVPIVWTNDLRTPLNSQVPTPLRALEMHDP